MRIDPLKVQKISNYLGGLHKDLLSRTDSPKYPITSLPYFNRKIWGMKSGALTVIAGRTSTGKSSCGLQFAYDLADGGFPTLFLSLEMNIMSLAERLFCNSMKVDNYSLLTGQFKNNLETRAKWETFTKVMKNFPLLITCEVGKTFREVNQLVEALNPPPKAVFIDYIGAIAVHGSQTREIMNEYIRKFRELAIKKDFIGVVCSQINRTGAVVGEEPQLHQLKETGTLEEHSDFVLLIHNPYVQTHNEDDINKATFIIAKNRNGRTGRQKVKFIPEHYRFEELGGIKREEKSFITESIKDDRDLLGVHKLFGGKIEKVQ